MITIRNLKKKYQTKWILDDLNLNINQGDIYGFLGRNGAGKTTTLNIITELIKKDSGDIIKPDQLKIGYLPESPKFYDYMSAYEYLLFLTSLEKKDKDKVNALLKLVDLHDQKKKPIKFYSRGMQQRLGIAAALIHDPDLILLDEPTSALDPQGRVSVMELIQKLKEQGKTILFSTHILSDVERICTRVGILNQGKLVLEGSIEDIVSEVNTYQVSSDDHGILHDLLLKDEAFNVTTYQGNHIAFTLNKEMDVLKHLSTYPVLIKEMIHLKPTLEDIFVKVVK
jgi:ABC-2 type transport system ATP-binding protein